MAEQNAIIPHHEETIDADQFFIFDENHDDPVISALIYDNLVGNLGSGFSGTGLEENVHNPNENSNNFPQNPAFGNPIQIPIWPVLPSPHSCTCCQTLRQFLHINGTHVHKLDIHGSVGTISHAVLERYNDASSQDRDYHMFDFCEESLSSVKQFLLQYCDDRKREGFIMLRDPLFYFYDALCVGFDSERTARGDETQMNREGSLNRPEEEGSRIRVANRHISSQRERTRKMKVKDLAAFFHLTVNQASKELNMCASAIKSICRKQGLRRWPYRKIKKLESDIAKEELVLNSNDEDKKAHALIKMNELRQKLARYYYGHI